MRRLAIFAAVLSVVGSLPAGGADPRHPDWPCRQIKVPSLSVAAMWTGPSLETASKQWQHEPQVAELVATLSQRRLPLAEAEQRASAFLAGKDGERQQFATLLFAGLFDTLNRERSTVMEGIERFSRRERAFASKIRTTASELRELQSSPNPDAKRVDELSTELSWDTRIYEDQQQTINYVCEVPQLIEQRLFALARTIQQALE